jgi:hypothetical protein
MAAGDFYIRRNASETTSVPNAGSNEDSGWDTLHQDEGGIVSYSDPNFQLDTGLYLIMYSEYFFTSDTTNNERIEIQGEIHVSGTGAVGGYGQGFIRKSSSDQRCAVRGSMILDVTSDNTDVFIRFYRTDDSTTGTVDREPGYGAVIILELDTNDNYGLYSTSSTDTVNSTESSLQIDTNDQQDTDFSRSGTVVDLASTGRYLATYSMDISQTGTGREEYKAHIELNGTPVPGSYSYCYLRGSDGCQDGALTWIGLIDVSAGDDLEVRHVSPAGGGTATIAAGAYVHIWQLPSGADTAIMEATNGDYNTATDFAWDTLPHIDTDSFTATAGNSNIDIDQTDHLLVFGSFSQDAPDTVQRGVPRLQTRVNNVNSQTAVGDVYHRNTAGIGTTAVTVADLLTIVPVNASIEINIEPTAASGSMINDSGQFSIISLESIFGYTYPPVITNAEDEQFDVTETDIIVDGENFEATQGTGVLELGDNPDYATATKVTQSIDSWSDTQIQFDISLGTLGEGTAWLFVTNNNGDTSVGYQVNVGLTPYDPSTIGSPDHFWSLDNTVNDLIGSNDVGSVIRGSPAFVSKVISRSTTYVYQFNDGDDGSEVPDSVYTNVTNTHSARNVGGWIEVDSYQLLPAAIYEEGGGVNNMYFILGFGNILLANVADSNNGWTAQSFSNGPLIPNRPYHIMLGFTGSGGNGDCRMWVDGVLQDSRTGTITSATMSTHSGDWSFGEPDGNLDTGGTDITYKSVDTLSLSNWGTWSNTGGGAPLSDANILQLFRDGAVQEYSITGTTQTVQQNAIDDYDNTTHNNTPLTYQIGPASSSGDVELTLVNQVFPDEISMHIRYTGSDTLTIRNSGTSNVLASKCYAISGGTIAIIETASVELTVRDITDNSAVSGSRVLLLASSGGPLPADLSTTITRSGSTATATATAHGLLTGATVLISGAVQNEYNGKHVITVTGANTFTYTVSGTPVTPATGTITTTAVILNGNTDGSGQISGEIDFTSNQPVVGYARKGTSSIYYKQSPIVATIPSAGLSATVLLIRDE